MAFWRRKLFNPLFRGQRGFELPLLLIAIAASNVSCHSDATAPGKPGLAVASITIDSAPATIERGTKFTFTATARDSTGKTVVVPFVWTSSVDSIGAFAATGTSGTLVTNDTGVTKVTASSLGVTSAVISIHVVWASSASIAALQFTAPSAASPGVTVPDSVRVLVTNLAGGPVTGAIIKFAVTAGGGTISPHAVATGTNGQAAAQWVLGPTVGTNKVTATVVAADSTVLTYVTGNPVTDSITTFNALSIVQGNAQTGTILAQLPIAPSVRLVDSAGNPRPGIPVSFTATGGGRVATPFVSTNAAGVAVPGAWTLGDTPGDQQLIATYSDAKIVLHATATGTAVHYLPMQIIAGAFSTCAINSDQTVSCWGQEPQAGGGDTASHSTPTPTKGGVTFTSLSASSTHFCGISTNQALYCWGTNALIDTAAFADTSAATADSLLDTTKVVVSPNVPTLLLSALTWLQVGPGFAHTCAVASDLTANCWGNNSVGQLGDNATTTHFVPTPVSGGFSFQALAGGEAHECGLTVTGTALCWGLNGNGQLGDGTTTTRPEPTAVSGALTFVSIGAGTTQTCGLSTAGQAYCWGEALGSGSLSTPTPFPGSPTFTSMTVGGMHACALTGNGTAYCWGDNASGQLGDSTTTFRSTPTPVAGGFKFSAISAGYEHTCGITQTEGAVVCWGDNQAGELGSKISAFFLIPRYIVLSVIP